MDIGVTVRDGWALVKNNYTGETTLCVPTVTEDYMHFAVVQKCDDYEDAMILVAAMRANGVSINDFRADPEEGSTEDDQQQAQEGSAEEPGGGSPRLIEAGPPVLLFVAE